MGNPALFSGQAGDEGRTRFGFVVRLPRRFTFQVGLSRLKIFPFANFTIIPLPIASVGSPVLREGRLNCGGRLCAFCIVNVRPTGGPIQFGVRLRRAVDISADGRAISIIRGDEKGEDAKRLCAVRRLAVENGFTRFQNNGWERGVVTFLVLICLARLYVEAFSPYFGLNFEGSLSFRVCLRGNEQVATPDCWYVAIQRCAYHLRLASYKYNSVPRFPPIANCRFYSFKMKGGGFSHFHNYRQIAFPTFFREVFPSCFFYIFVSCNGLVPTKAASRRVLEKATLDGQYGGRWDGWRCGVLRAARRCVQLTVLFLPSHRESGSGRHSRGYQRRGVSGRSSSVIILSVKVRAARRVVRSRRHRRRAMGDSCQDCIRRP